MGFDLSGCNPIINERLDDTMVYGMIKSIDKWEEQQKMYHALDDNDRHIYWKQYEQYHEDNPGVYFRNNVWWWRPLWNYVCNTCDDILTDKDMHGGDYNNGYKITKTKANKISKRLYNLIETGIVSKFEKHFMDEQEKASKSDDKDTKFFSQYPFSEENVKEFALFCKESGGFEIW